MEIVKIPIVDYFKYCLDAAHQRGFIWVMFLLARDADAEEAYQQVKRYWNSLNDLTGKNILFLFAGKQVIEKQSDSLLHHETVSYRALTNPSVRFINDNIPTVPYNMYPPFDYEKYQINEIEVTHTRSITELRDFFGLSEKDIPSLIFIPTDLLVREKKVIVKLQDENIYRIIKEIIESLEEPLRKLIKAQDNYAQINGRLIELIKEIKHLKKSTKALKRFAETKSYLDRLVQDTTDSIIKNQLKDAINNKSNYDRDTFASQTRINLNQYHDLLKRYPSIENDSKAIMLHINNLESEKRELEFSLCKENEEVILSYDELAQVIQGIKQHTPPTKAIVHQGARRFKVALSFPGEHRALVSRVAEKLVTIYGKEQILYDKYHRAEFSRPNLDTHLQKLYRYESDLIVVFICTAYQRKEWCGIEWRAIRDLLNQNDMDDRIMFVKCGEGSVDGVFGTIDGNIDSNEVVG